MDTAP